MRARSLLYRARPGALIALGAGIAAAFGFTTSDAAQAAPDPVPFSIVVTPSPDGGVVATCEAGCAWERVSADNPAGKYRITQEGIFHVPQQQ
jgi:hypothetical protein